MEKQYEVISYTGQNYKFTVGTERYCMPHIHRELELGMILRGNVVLNVDGRHKTVRSGDFMLLNPCQSHETYSENTAESFDFVELQLSPAFFKSYFPEISRREFSSTVITPEDLGEENHRELAGLLTDSALCYFRQEPRYELKCAAMINRIFDLLLELVPSRLLDNQEMQRASVRKARIQRIADWMGENYEQKLLLSELAEREQLSMTHLSHFFTENFGMPFQEYLTHLRCQRAAELLRTNLPMAEVSLACGFSAPRYLDRGFRKLYGMSPREYRALHGARASRAAARDREEQREWVEAVIHPAEDAVRVIEAALERRGHD